MSGSHTTYIDQQRVEYGDICRALLGEAQQRWIACTFVERSEDGAIWLRCLCEHDRVQGYDTFSDHYMGVYDVEFVCKADDPRFFIGDGI